MREIPAEMNRAWKSGQFVGRDRPYVALVLRQPRMRLHSSSHPAPRQQNLAPSGIPFRRGWGARRSVAQKYASYLWGDSVKPVLLPNIKSFSWSRGVSQDVGQATIELWNTNPYPFGAEVHGDPLRAGYFSYNFGGMQHSSRWGHLKNEWFGKLVPDMLIESYEGYGHSEGVAPERDGLLLQTGVWRIRDVEMTAGDRVMRITCEDLGSLLTEQIAFPPVVPNDWYPLSFGPIPDPIRTDTVVPGGNVGIRITKTSNLPWNNDRPVFGWAKENVLDGSHHCVDDKTEILTKRGWLTHDQLEVGDETVGIDPETWEATWTPVTAVNRFAFDGELNRIKFRRHDSLTTDGHKWPTRRRQRGKSTAGGYLYEMRTTVDLSHEDCIPLEPGVIAGLPTVKSFSDEFVELVAWWVTDGGLCETSGYKQLTLHQSVSANSENCDRINAVLRRGFGEPYGTPGVRRAVRSSFLGKYRRIIKLGNEGYSHAQIAAMVGSDIRTVGNTLSGGTPAKWSVSIHRHNQAGFGAGKEVVTSAWYLSPEVSEDLLSAAPGRVASPEFLTALTDEQLELFIEVCTLADGWKTSRGQHFICAEREDEAKSYEMAALLAGYSVSTFWEDREYTDKNGVTRPTGIWKTQILRGDRPLHPLSRDRGKRVTRERYAGVVWCPTTGTGTWLMRRNGKVVFTGNSSWLSVGNVHPSRGFAYEYIEFALNQPGFVSEVTFSTVNKGYTAYLSVSTDNRQSWHGTEVIGWRSESIGRNGGNIPFVQSQPVGSEDTHSFAVNMDGVTHFRVTLGNLQHFGQFPGYKYRGAFREIAARGGPRTVTTFTELVPKTAEAGSHAGVAKDWTDVIKMCLAWAGWYWPRGSRRMLSDGTVRITSPTQPDQVLAADGRVWGDVEVAGTMGPAGYKNLAKQPLRQVIQGVLDVLGHVFFIDETGAAIVRSPNLFTVGNWYRSRTGQTVRTEQVTPLDEATCILDIRTRISGRNIRDRISVGNPMNVQEGDKSGGVSASVAGWNPNPTGLRRHALWLDQGFATENEALVMADMIAVRGAFTYRTSEITITANPGIQVDDQVRVYERNTSEGYLHYVDAISSEMDCTTGQWTYTLTTHWLGSDPEGVWALNKRMLTQPTRELTFRNAAQKLRIARNLKGGS